MLILNVEEFANLIGVHPQTIYRNKGDFKKLNLEYLPRVGYRFIFDNESSMLKTIRQYANQHSSHTQVLASSIPQQLKTQEIIIPIPKSPDDKFGYHAYSEKVMGG
jgi:hypothetical protein